MSMRVFAIFFTVLATSVLCGLGLASCALSPQTVAVLPAIDVRAEPIGRGREILLAVIDQRPQQAIGARGGIYDTATITPRTDVVQGVEQALAERLEASGFNVIKATGELAATPELGLQVAVLSIDYQALTGSQLGTPLLNEIKLSAEVNATATNSSGSRTGQYQALSQRRQMGYPNAEENEIMINDVLARALKQLLEDRNILELLAQ